jgi:hypothetical protein
MPKKNGQVCCILGVCCRTTEKKAKALAELLEIDGCASDVAATVSAYITANFDLVPKGSLDAFVAAIADEAHAHPKG